MSDFADLIRFLFVLTLSIDVASALLSYFLVSYIAKWISKHKMLVKFGSWTTLFFGFVSLLFVFCGAIVGGSVPSFQSLLSVVLMFCFVQFPFNIVFLGTWIFGGVLAAYETPEGYK